MESIDTTNMGMYELRDEIQRLFNKTVTLEAKNEQLKKDFVQEVINYDGGCSDGKLGFLEQCGLESYVPKAKATIEVEIEWDALECGSFDQSDLSRCDINDFIAEGIYQDYDFSPKVSFKVTKWGD